ncbi:hypothetical protein [Flavobacterium sp.]|uniref:hypothetical protein n=1 Tax=Flavobacterium sp. TaxID=239 RepID=UPI00120AD096|nr:hypothetical protein [Flavobacterium sp.]RZJ69046.1 MAG: hypothetical protein EOO49_18800 [Flavobacterium sp.]
MDELDLLKKDWKRSENAFNQVSDKEIYAMLHKKSSSIVKWILIISILELLFWLALGLLPFADGDFGKKYANYEFYSGCFTYFNYAVVAVFICLFYRNYVSISTTDSTSKLTDNIIRTRKTVNYYVWYNLAMMVTIFVVGLVLEYLTNPKMDPFRERVQSDGSSMAILLVIFLLIVLAFAFLAWLFYKLLYGFLMKKLLVNYKELKKIEL